MPWQPILSGVSPSEAEMNSRMRMLSLMSSCALIVTGFQAGASIVVINADGTPAVGTRITCGTAQTLTDTSGLASIEQCDIAWAQRGVNPPVAVRVVDGTARLPRWRRTQALVRDAETGRPVAQGKIRWNVPGAPGDARVVEWDSGTGRCEFELDSRGSGVIEVTGYRPVEFMIEPGDERRVVLIKPIVDLQVVVAPPAKGTVKWCRDADLGLTQTFGEVAESVDLDESGRATLKGAPRSTLLTGVVLTQGMAPKVFSIVSKDPKVQLRQEKGGCVHATIQGPNGAPLAGAQLRVEGKVSALDGILWMQTGQSGPEGVAETCGLPVGPAVVQFIAKGMATERHELQVNDATKVDLGVVRLEKGAELTGRVVADGERPVPGARLTVGSERTTSGRQGEFAISGLKCGSVALDVNADGFLATNTRNVEAPGTVIIRLERGATARWVIENAPQVGNVKVAWDMLDKELRPVRSGAGEWDSNVQEAKATRLRPGQYRLTAKADNVTSLQSEVFQVANQEEISVPSSRFERGLGVRGRVVQRTDGQPAAGAHVRLERGSPSDFRTPSDIKNALESACDAEGEFEIFGLKNGSYRLSITQPGLAPYWRDSVAAEADGRDLGTIELTGGFSVHGRVTARSGDAISQVRVEAWEGKPFEFDPFTSTRTNENGEFDLNHLPDGRILLTAKSGGKEAKKEIEGQDGDTVNADLSLGGIRVRGQALLGDAPLTRGELVWNDATSPESGSGVMLLFTRSDGETRSFGGTSQSVRASLRSDGSFITEVSRPGPYRVTYLQGRSASVVIEIPDLEEASAVVRFPSGEVVGRTVGVDGESVGTALVSVTSATGNPTVSDLSGSDGAFRLIGLAPGQVSLSARAGDNLEAAPVQVLVRENESTGPVTLVLKRKGDGRVFGTLAAAMGTTGGAPVALIGPDTRMRFCDPAGRYSFEGVVAGEYRLCARSLGGIVGCTATFAVDRGDQEVPVVLATAGRVLAVLPIGASPAKIRVATGDGIDLTALAVLGSTPTQANGVPVVLGLFAPGTYLFSCQALMRSDTITVQANQEVTIDWRK